MIVASRKQYMSATRTGTVHYATIQRGALVGAGVGAGTAAHPTDGNVRRPATCPPTMTPAAADAAGVHGRCGPVPGAEVARMWGVGPGAMWAL
jgi:hypothetical protein